MGTSNSPLFAPPSFPTRDTTHALLQLLEKCPDIGSLLKTLSRILHPIIGANSISIFLFKSGLIRNEIYLVDSSERHEYNNPGPIKLDDACDALHISSAQSNIACYGIAHESCPLGDRAIGSHRERCSCCFVPLVDPQYRGFLRIRYNNADREADITHHFNQLIEMISFCVSSAIKNIISREEINQLESDLLREQKHLKILLEVTNAISSKLEMQALLEEIAKAVEHVFHNQYSSLIFHDSERNMLQWEAVYFPGGATIVHPGTIKPMDDSPVSVTFKTGEPFVIDYETLCKLGNDFPVSRAMLAAGIRSLCSVPLTHRGKTLGVLTIGHTDCDHIPAKETDLLNDIAGQIAISVDNAMAYQRISLLTKQLERKNSYLEEELKEHVNIEGIIGASQALANVFTQVEMVADSDCSVLILGETGTGKELIARAIHNLSARRSKTLVKLNCAAIPTGLLESYLFGHERGAFTGAISQKIGRLELAHQGTLFLDEIGDIPMELQPKLLRVLQEQEFERVGGVKLIEVDVRIIAATNRDLEEMIRNKEFRSDLFYRLNVFPIFIPPLRERIEDIPLLARHFMKKYAKKLKRDINHIPAEIMDALMQYAWPGNVRELEHIIERAVILSRGTELNLSLDFLKKEPFIAASQLNPESSENRHAFIPQSNLKEMERQTIMRVLQETKGVIAGPNGAAARLGLKRTTLIARMRRLDIVREKNQGIKR
ncbi:sigma 54-interacting transcriptional regulator [Brenneria goodwinii]|uniref:sigma 54-interacting transcriptional regulator n=1 Tax=Brenneria goodwinii TaxID=1109412 RepID=UPI000EF21AB4|nr:sigma 54-interacting transcriptional regulator [Brenneria goodwinii]MCG8158987.1 sigma 54-interacting transcriptional regulator [Brenneria goodwinii]MCG8163506.1 sigma 54-interacting transcriptional regulator [Brenneria goodwinii]MCG8168074.1 sigma 54-interacting transcriptional regulator [Brenneria goodwinii]MCG8172865.1 sigma 54-interacting transcriptional regulator [Brenneria goodwinii]MCG8177554.1 sigma 54-interacting transcriptional regulator [Brenneria goodwinii]